MRIVLTAMFLGLALAPAAASSIASHRAVYDLSLARASEGAGMSSVTGRLAYEVQGSACEGWTVNFRMANRFAPAEGEVRMTDMQSTSYESGDFLDMRYTHKEFVNGSLMTESRIKASRAGVAAEGLAEKEGANTSLTIPGGALFPMQHQIHLMDVAGQGGTHDSSILYDASDNDKVFRVISFIGKPKGPGQNVRDLANPAASALAGLLSWPVSISYYPMQGAEDTPDYQISFDLYENGVATGLLLDYGQFALKGQLLKLETFETGACN